MNFCFLLRHRYLPSTSLQYGAFALALFVLVSFSFMPHSVQIRYQDDDAYYYFLTAYHLAQGHGPTFDGITTTTGFHPLYALLLTGIQMVFPVNKEWLPTCANLLNTCAIFFTAYALYHAAKRLWNQTAARWAAFLWIINPHALILVYTGMEGSIYAAALGLFLLNGSRLFTTAASSSRLLFPTVLAGCSASLCILSRTDSMILVILIIPLFLWLPAQSVLNRFALMALYVVLAFLPYVLWAVYCNAWTGDWIQGSAEMKTILRQWHTEHLGALGSVLYTFQLFLQWCFKSLIKTPMLKYLLLSLIVFGLWKRVRLPFKMTASHLYVHTLWLFLVLLGLAYAMHLNKMWTWYYTPSLLILTLISSGILQTLIRSEPVSIFKRYLPYILIFTLLESYAYLTLKSITGRNARHPIKLHVTEWINDHLPADAVIGSWNAGIFAWNTESPVINLDGLINNDVPTLYQANGSICQYILDKKIDYIVEDSNYMELYCPQWNQNHYQRIYRYQPGESDLSVWKILPPVE